MSRCSRGPADIFRSGHTGCKEVHGLTDEGVLQAVDQKAGHVPVNPKGQAAEPFPDGRDPVRCRVRGLLPANDFHDGHDMARLDEVRSGNPAFVSCPGGQPGDGQARSVARKECFRRGQSVHLLEERLFGLQVLGDGFDDEGRPGYG